MKAPSTKTRQISGALALGALGVTPLSSRWPVGYIVGPGIVDVIAPTSR